MRHMNRAIKGRTVLITGGTGSFGRAMLSHLLERGIGEVRIFSRDEEKQDTLRNELNERRLRFFIGDVRSPRSIDEAMEGVDYVFHAAALKQVPSCEFFPIEATRTNVDGSQNVIDAARKHRVGTVVCLSTDKAVYPVNAMGMSKAMMEKVAQAAARQIGTSGTRIACVRYGNVLYSRGSVVPLLIKLIKAGRPLTVTNPAMTRYLMPLRDAVSLVEYAMLNAIQGDIFIRKAPAARLGDLVQAVRNLFPQQKSELNLIGSRHGEKMFETLATADEVARSRDFGEYLGVPLDTRGLNYEAFFTEGNLTVSATVEMNSHTAVHMTVQEIEALLLSLPEVQADISSAA